jgi:hypothetical protein
MWVVRLEGDRFHSAWDFEEQADSKVEFLNQIGTSAYYGFEANIRKEDDKYNISSLNDTH